MFTLFILVSAGVMLADTLCFLEEKNIKVTE